MSGSLASSLTALGFPGPAGRLEGLWKEASGPARGSAVFAHPHPLFGGTLHNKVVYRATQALTAAGFATLRFNFRGVGQSDGLHDEGRGEVGDFRAALDAAAGRGGLPLIAGGFSFGSAVALRAASGDGRIAAIIAVGVPLATVRGADLPKPRVPALFVTGERDTYGPPDRLFEFVGNGGQIVIVPGADHFFEGRLAELEETIRRFLASLPVAAPMPADTPS